MPTGGCWVWTGSLFPSGYGRLAYHGKSLRAHRFVYETLVGPLGDTQLDHVCHIPEVCNLGTDCPHRACVNPTHLRPSTARDNVLRSNSIQAVNARKTHCINGHELTPENNYPSFAKLGQRACRTCGNERAARRYAALKEA